MGYKKVYKGKNKRIGILGGTFNPIHMGHMHMAENAAEYMDLDRVVFLLCAIPAHKELDYDVSVKDRLNMLEFAADDDKRYFIDDSEAKNDYTTYTYQSLHRIKDMMHQSSTLFFIIGADSLMHLDNWKRPDIFFHLAEFIVIPRGDYSKEQCEEKIDYLHSRFGAEIHYIDCEKFHISSTKIRDGKTADNKYIDSDVHRYIINKGLYKK